jgi:catalase
MVWHLLLVEDELGLRVGEGIGISVDDVRHLEPLPTQTLNDEERPRLVNLGRNGAREVTDKVMMHCVPNERVAVADVPTACPCITANTHCAGVAWRSRRLSRRSDP